MSRLNELPRFLQFAITGAGVSGLLLARRILCEGYQCGVLEKSSNVGGVWHSQANKSSRVNTSEAAYRLVERGFLINFDHTPASLILDDLSFVSAIYLS